MLQRIEQISLARAQRSLGPGNPEFPLTPPLVAGCPTTSSEAMQYPLEVAYDYEKAGAIDFTSWASPVTDQWAALLPPIRREACLAVGGTPLLDIGALAPDHLRDRRILFKDESRNPTWSHKDRLNLCTVSAALAAGASTIIVASSGNHGVSAAAFAARAGLNCIVITMPDVSAAFRDMILGYGAYPVYVTAAARWPAMRELMKVDGVHPVSNLTPVHTGHPWGPEGYKTIAFELLSQLGGEAPAAVVVPTGYGELLFGIHKGFRELKRLGKIKELPQLISAEPAARGPLFHALASGVEATTVTPSPTVQYGTACTVNGYRSVVALRESQGMPLLVDDAAAIAAQRKLGKQGLWQEVAPSAAVAALTQIKSLKRDGAIVVIGCSTGLKEPTAPGKAVEVTPDLGTITRHLKAEYNFDLG